MDTLPLKRDLRLAYRTSLLVALLMVLVSAGGLAWGTSLYGVDPHQALRVSASTAGVLVPGFLVQDLFNLVGGLPILVGTLWLSRRGSLIGLLLWPGALFYLVYTYLHYLVGAPFGPLFLGYVAIVALSAYTTIGLVAKIDGDTVRQRLTGAVRPRLVGGILVGLALLTVGQDSGGAVGTALAGSTPTDPLARGVWIADLTLGVPAMLIVGGLLWRRASLGYMAAAGLLLSFGMSSVVIAAMLALQPVLTGAPIDGATVMGLLIFGAVSLAPIVLFARGTASQPVRAETRRAARWISRGEGVTMKRQASTSDLTPHSSSGGSATRLGFWTAILTVVVVAVFAVVSPATPPRSGPFCGNACVAYPYVDVAQFIPGDYFWLLPGIAGIHTSGWFDSLTALAVLAASTKQLTIGTASLVVGFRNPVVLAKQLASIAVIAGPRVVLGAGSGWHDAEYAALGYRIDERGARTDETLAAVRQLLESPGGASFAGRHWSFEDVTIDPRPAWRVPIWVAGGSRTPDAGSERDLPRLASSVLQRILAYDGWIAPCAGSETLTLSDLGQVEARIEPDQNLRLAHVQWTHIVDTDDTDEALREQLPRFRALMGEHHTDEHFRETYLLGSRPDIEARVRRLRQAGFEDLIVGPVVHDHAQTELIAASLGPTAHNSD